MFIHLRKMYRVIAADIFPAGRLEDPDLFFMDGEYHMVMEDNAGALKGKSCCIVQPIAPP